MTPDQEKYHRRYFFGHEADQPRSRCQALKAALKAALLHEGSRLLDWLAGKPGEVLPFGSYVTHWGGGGGDVRRVGGRAFDIRISPTETVRVEIEGGHGRVLITRMTDGV